MKQLILIPLVLAYATVTADAAGKIKQCGSSARQTIQEARDFVENNINTIISNVGDLKNGEKRKLRRKIGKINIKCGDHKRVCNRPDLLGIERHVFGKAFVMCYNNIRDLYNGMAFCKIAGNIVHEAAHSAGVKKDRGHNNGPNNDRVYRLGNAAQTLCRQNGLDGTVPLNTNN